MAEQAFDPYVTPQDYFVLQGARSPGIAKITGAADRRKWDIQQGYALSGGITIYRGKEIAKFSAVITLATPQDWIDWAAWRKIVARPPNGTFPKAMTIEHPWLRMLEIHEVSIEEVGQPEESDETGAWTVTIKFLEYRLPKPVFLKPEAAKVKPTDDPQSLEIAALTAQKLVKAARVKQYQGGE